MTDIVQRLRHEARCMDAEYPGTALLLNAAADEIERRKADIAHLDTKLDDVLDEIERLRQSILLFEAGDIELARINALEEAAQVAEDYGSNYPMARELPKRAFYAKDIAAAIRALKEKAEWR
jgi:hypothetical protein